MTNALDRHAILPPKPLQKHLEKNNTTQGVKWDLTITQNVVFREVL